MNKILSTLLVGAMTIGIFGCSKKNNAPANSSPVMFVNGWSPTAKIDAKVNGVVVPGAEAIAFQRASGYKYVTAGPSVSMGFYVTDLGDPVINQTVSLKSGSNYSVFIGGRLTQPTFLLTLDDLSAPTSSNARIRLVNLSPDSLHLTASAGSNFATNVGINSASVFTPVTAGQYDLKVVDPSNVSTAVILSSQMLNAGKIYTLMLTGSQSGTGNSGLKLTLLNNN
jgi:hypothetical protein